MEIAHKLNQKLQSRTYLTILILSGILFFIPFLGRVHLFDWDEINFAESAREMLVSGNFHRVQINFQPFWEKPPLFFWMQAGCMKIFGVNEFAARLPNAIFGIITLVTLFVIGKKYKNPRFGFIWAMCFFGTFLPHVYAKSGIIDPVFNYFIFLGIYFMYREVGNKTSQKNLWSVGLSGLFIGLATLTKGPVALLVFLLAFLAYFALTRFRNFPSFKKILVFTIPYIVVCFFWFGIEIIRSGFWFLDKFLAYQADLFLHPVASHGEPFYYHFVVVAVGCFPISIFALPVMGSSRIGGKNEFKLLMKILFWTVMILFSITTTKIVHYSSLTYMPLAFLAAIYLDRLMEEKTKTHPLLTALLIGMGLFFSFLLAALPYMAQHPQLIIPYLKDPFAVAALGLPVQWSGNESLIGVGYFLMVLLAVGILQKRKIMEGILVMFYATALCLMGYLIWVVPKIERYSQGPAIDFYQSLQGKNVYVWPVGFKSYAQYFYTQKKPEPVYGEKDLPFLLKGKITRPAFFVVKVGNKEFDSTCARCQLIRQEGGFRFYERTPNP
ncbi:MAG: glycosyltransferase family 39 protein [Bacteroidota bacterium]|nr:glycosyltransferase family 39 protein [Bacteroidota bacterium]